MGRGVVNPHVVNAKVMAKMDNIFFFNLHDVDISFFSLF